VAIGAARPLQLELLEDSLQPIALFDRLVVEEGELRHTLQSQPLSDLASEERCGAVERARRFPARRVVTDGRVIHQRLLQIRRDLDLRDGQEADARIVHVSRQERRELRADLVADTGRS